MLCYVPNIKEYLLEVGLLVQRLNGHVTFWIMLDSFPKEL